MWRLRSPRPLTDWRRFEERAAQHLLRDAFFEDYSRIEQKVSRSTLKRPDLFMWKGRERVVVDAKWCVRASNSHLKQLSSYKGYPFFAKRALLMYPKNVHLPKSFETNAAARGIAIILLPVRKKRKGLFERGYRR